MASNLNPLQMLAAMRASQGAGFPMGGPGGPTGANTEQSGQQVASQLSGLKDLNIPQLIQQYQGAYQTVVNDIPRFATRVPKVMGGLSNIAKGYQAVIEELKKAALAMDTVQPINSAPVGLSAAGPGPGAPGQGPPGQGSPLARPQGF